MADLSPPWILFVDDDKPVAILPAGRPGEVLNVEGWPLKKAQALIDAANQESSSFNARMTRATERAVELFGKVTEAEAAAANPQSVKAQAWLPSITCPSCKAEYEGSEVEYDGDERDENCFMCGQNFFVTVKVVTSYQCGPIGDPPAQEEAADV